MKRLLLLALLAIGAACSEPLTTEPSATSAVTAKATFAPQAANRRADLIADAVDRITPAFGESAAAVAARSGLRTLEATLAAGDETGARGALPAIENALDMIERDEPGHAADIAALRLAIAAL